MLASVVVPVYNSEEYVIRCLESLIAQRYGNYEIIVVDDGSIDNSLQLCQSLKSDCLRIYHKSNGGPASARNFGISKCSPESKFLFFVDSDDTVSPDYISSMIEYAAEDSLVICGINHLTPESYTSTSRPTSGAAKGKHSTVTDFWANYDFMKKIPYGIINSSCNKCYSLETIRRNGLKFRNEFPEDTLFNIKYLEHCGSVELVDAKLYNYIHRPGSVSKSPNVSLYSGYIDIQKRLYKVVPERLRSFVDEFVYPQYLANTKLFIRKNEYDIPRKYLKDPFVKRAIASHKVTCMGDWLVKKLLQLKLFNLLIKL